MEVAATLSCMLVLMAMGCAGMLSGRMAGGATSISVDPKDAEVVFALQKINDYFGSKEDKATRTLVQVLEATSQVVRGTMYKLKLEISGSDKGNEICNVAVWSQPWLDDVTAQLQIMGEIDCSLKQGVPNGEAIQDSALVSEEKEALHAFERSLNQRMFNIYYMRVKNQPDVETETTSSGKTTFKFSNIQMTYTQCMKDRATALGGAAQVLHDCPVNDDAETKLTCSATISKEGDSYTVDTQKC